MSIAEQVAALEREIVELRTKIAERDATIARLVGAMQPAAPAPPLVPPAPFPSFPSIPGVNPFKINDHGGMCACPQCCPPFLCVHGVLEPHDMNIGGPPGVPVDRGQRYGSSSTFGGWS